MPAPPSLARCGDIFFAGVKADAVTAGGVIYESVMAGGDLGSVGLNGAVDLHSAGLNGADFGQADLGMVGLAC